MSDPFEHAYAKLNRADEHIAQIESTLASLPKRYTASVEINPTMGNEVIKYEFDGWDEVVTDLALVIGDALNNLRSALDYTWHTTIKHVIPHRINSDTKFPFRKTLVDLRGAINGIEINPIKRPTLFNLIVDDIQPYEGGNDTLWAVHELNNLDKHILLVPMVHRFSVAGIEIESEYGERIFAGALDTPEHPPYFIPILEGWHVKDKGNPILAIDFGERSPIHGLDIQGQFPTFSKAVRDVVEVFDLSLDSF